MTAETVPDGFNVEIARVLHAALGALLGTGGDRTEPNKLLYSPEEAAEMLGLESTNQLYRRTSDGTWPYTLIGKSKKFSRADLDRIVEIQSRDAVVSRNRRRRAA